MAVGDCDVVIVGGGLVGASLACALAPLGLNITVAEAHRFDKALPPSYDDRSIALAYGSRRIMDAIGVWPMLADQAAPIRHIHISNRGHFGFTRLHSREAGVDALGYVIEQRVLGQALAAKMRSHANITVAAPARLTGIEHSTDRVSAQLDCGGESRVISARLLVAADGQDSAARHALGIGVQRDDYDQVAIIANVTPERFHGHVAYERFTDSGPLALLPLNEGRCSLVWTVRPDAMGRLMALEDMAFLSQLQQAFGQRLGRFLRVGRRSAYPLSLVRAKEHARQRVALIGNAAHTLHPVAGQGFNLGIRDVAALAHVVAEASREHRDVGSDDVLTSYVQWRERDHAAVITFTDVLARVFANPWAPVAVARNAGLVLLDLLPGAKRAMLRRTMGLAGTLPRLGRGLPT